MITFQESGHGYHFILSNNLYRFFQNRSSLKKILLAFLIVIPYAGMVQAEEMNLRFLVWEGYAPREYTEKFEAYIEKKHNVSLTIEVAYVSNSDSFYDPIRSKEVDIVAPPYHMFKDERWGLMDRELILPLNLNNIPNYYHISPALRQADYLLRNGKTYAVPLVQGPYGLVYNKRFVKEAPLSWNVLWNPKYKNNYVIAENEYMLNCMFTALALGYPREVLTSFDALNNDEFKSKLNLLAINAHSFWDGVDKADDLYGHSLGTSWGFSLKGLKERGEIWKIANPKEGTVYWVDNYAITWAVKDKPLLRAIAEEWCNYVLSPEFQVDVVMRNLTCNPVTTNIKHLVTKEEIERFHLDFPEEYQKTRIAERNLSLRDRNGLKLLWDGAKQARNK